MALQQPSLSRISTGSIEAAIKDNTKALYIETLGNPNSDVVDIEAIAKVAHAHKIPLVVDNTFATPFIWFVRLSMAQTSWYILQQNSLVDTEQQLVELS